MLNSLEPIKIKGNETGTRYAVKTVNGVGNKQFASGQRIRAEQDYISTYWFYIETSLQSG